MGRVEKQADQTFQNVKRMYNAHPFPHRYGTPDAKSDERYHYIYENFLHIPVSQLRNINFLDAGCGTGDVTWVWRRLLHPTNKLFALDLSTASVNIARHADNSAPLTPIFTVGSLLDIPLPDNSIDFVHCSGVLVAVTEPERAFAELARILKPGGYIILILYHKYGRLAHGLRRAVIDWLEPDDIDRRAQLGGQLFGRAMRRVVQDEDTPLTGLLYDQFGLPCETRYSMGDALRWFQQANIVYLGSWLPIEWSQLGKGIRFAKHFVSPYSLSYRLLTHIFADTEKAPASPPTCWTRLTMEFLWAVKQQEYFAIAGHKAA